ncbi:hypothetical protein KAFR_0B04040 [Kazachstania africana CBS 2517]|uniref:Multivesicular body sorting factor 12 domain-containing protein n=1 Tax=Kazachstania africana (strain ATCC 22294 / BCRC 22015 / CBS 2517 / CECT 1963 / NBRC 1671 / NRRL Y-8276) TaxID=1071382 RepID=H2AQQ0_KAZAF|nr:hypothetical protein KAFR_0B04040 [Kazachstania africana CBS 2517]CCF56700.1 hypothetical protein KAFR_0B04040 [Kazachstania africana CBS 2517]
MSNINYQELLRKIPLYNKYGDDYPDKMLPKLDVPEIKIQPLPPINKTIEAWITELDKAVDYWSKYSDNNIKEFNDWYNKKYLSNKPPGLVNSSVLSPVHK